MTRWLKATVLLTVLAGVGKAHHLIKVVILAALGLAGLWMVHTLAQDYQKITAGSGGFADAGKFFAKRSVDERFEGNGSTDNNRNYGIDWERILSRDPVSCARSFICQLAAQKTENLSVEEKNILNLIRYSAEQDSWASKELYNALKNGDKADSAVQCRKYYKFCPYSSSTMMYLLRMFGGR